MSEENYESLQDHELRILKLEDAIKTLAAKIDYLEVGQVE